MEAAWNIATTVMKNKEKEIEPFSCIIQWMEIMVDHKGRWLHSCRWCKRKIQQTIRQENRSVSFLLLFWTQELASVVKYSMLNEEFCKTF